MKNTIRNLFATFLLVSFLFSMLSITSFAASIPPADVLHTISTLDLDSIAKNPDGTTINPANGTYGKWYFYNTDATTNVGIVRYTENSITISRTSSTKDRTIVSRYTPPAIGFTKDTSVIDFEYTPSFREEWKQNQIQYIVLSSNDLGSGYTYPEFATGSTDILMKLGATIFNDSITLAVGNGGVRYADDVSKTFKTIEGLNITNTKYYIKAVVNPELATFDLYFDTQKIGINSKKILENIPLAGTKTGVVPSHLNTYIYSKPFDSINTSPNNMQNFTIANFRIAQMGSSYLVNENFQRPIAAESTAIAEVQPSTVLGTPWSYKIRRTTRVMASAGTVADPTTASNTVYRLGDFDSALYGAGSFVYYDNSSYLSRDNIEVALDFITKPNTAPNDKVSQSIMLTSNATFASSLPAGYNDYAAYFATAKDSVALYILNDGTKNGFYFGDESQKKLTKLPTVATEELAGVEFVANTKYYLKIKLNNLTNTFNMYLANTPITETTKPVVQNASVYWKQPTPAKARYLFVNHYEDAATAPNIMKSDIFFDNLRIKEPTTPVVVDNTLKSYDDNGDAITSLTNTTYVDVYGEGTQTFIIASYDLQDRLVGIEYAQVINGMIALRLPTDYLSIKKVTIFEFDNINSITPVRQNIVLNKQ